MQLMQVRRKDDDVVDAEFEEVDGKDKNNALNGPRQLNDEQLLIPKHGRRGNSTPVCL